MGKRKYEDTTEKDGGTPLKHSKNDESSDNEEAGVVDQNEDSLSEFNIKHFRKELNAQQGQTIALTQFLQVCTNPDAKHDHMLQYLKAGGNSHEILRQLTQDNKKNLTLATPTFHLFHLIILKVQSSMPHMIAITEEACRYFLNTFMPTVEIMISEHSGPRHRKIILKLFTSMVTLNPDLGIEILNQAPLTPKHLQYIVEKANYKEKDNVRTAFVHFITSFLVEGHLPLIKALLEKQGLVSLVIPGLVQDEGDAVLMFLNILKTNVIENINISKSMKLRTFSHQVLHNMFKIFFWKGPPEVEYQSKIEVQFTVSALLSEILLILFTSHKYGLYFLDKSLGTTDTHKNQNLYKAMLLLKRPWENKNQCELILNIVDKCPDLHRALITVIEQSFEPQNTPAWLNSANFVVNLLDKIQPQNIIERMDRLNPVQITNFIRFTTLPIPILKFLKQGINEGDMFITTECVKVVVKMLGTVKKYLDLLEMNNSTIADLIKNRLEGFIPKHLPSPDTIVSIIHQIISPEKEGKNQPTEPTQPDKASSLIVLLDLLLLFYDIHPTGLEGIEGYLDMKKILIYSNTLTSKSVLLLKFKIVSLWLSFDPSAISLKKPMFSDLFLIMLEVYTHDDESISLESKNTLYNFLKSTSMFESAEGEIDLVLHALRNAKVEPASLLVDAMKHTLANAVELKQFIRTQTTDVGLLEPIDSSTVDKLFEDLASDNIQNIESHIFIDERIPSPFILGCLQLAKESKGKREALKNFLSLYVVNLLHYYTSPILMSNLLETYHIKAKNYITGWMQEPTYLNESVAPSDEILHKISKFILNEEEISLDEVFPYFEIVSEENCNVKISGLYLKFMSPITIDSSELIAWANLTTFHLLQLTQLEVLMSTQEERIKKCFYAIIAIGNQCKMVDICRKAISNFFSNPLMLKFFCPIEKPKTPSHKLATQFLLSIVKECKKDIDYLQHKLKILYPYQQKNFVEVKKGIKKIAKKKMVIDDDHTLRILAMIGMNNIDTLATVNIILNIETKCLVTDSNEPSLPIKVLGLTMTQFSVNTSNSLPSEVITNLFDLYTSILINAEINVSMIDFECILKDYFEKQPHHVKLISKDSFRNFFSSKVIRKSTSELAAALLQRNSNFCEVFKEEIQNPDIIDKRELALPLGNAVIDHVQFVNDNKPLLESIYKEYKSSIAKVLEKPHKVGQIYSSNWKFIRKLIFECMELDNCKKFFGKVHKFETFEPFHIHLLQATFIKVCTSPDSTQKKEYLLNYFLMMINLLSSALKAECEYDFLKEITMYILNVAQISKGIKAFETKNKENFKKLIETSSWQNFCKAALKDSMKIKKSNESNQVIGPIMLSLLSTLVKLFYPFNHEDIVSIFDMVTSHSEFLNVMLSHHSTDIKARLVEFLYILILRNKSVMKGPQIPVYLSAYHATRNPGDRLILTILHFYETNGQPIHEYKPYVWGDSGANYYSIRKNRSTSLWGHPTPNQILNLLEKEIIEKTVTHFPVNQRLDYHYELPSIDDSDMFTGSLLEQMKSDGVFEAESGKDIAGVINRMVLKNKYDRSIKKIKEVEFTSSSHCEEEREAEGIYDPLFVLPMMSHMLAPGSVVSCFKLVRLGLLAIPLAALASHCPAMRAAAYHVLHRFCLQLETETKHRNDKLLLTDFVDTLRQSLSTAIVTVQREKDAIKDQKNPRLPAIAAVYLARALNAATAPFDPLYKPVNNFLIAKQQIDLTVVPDFLSLFHDSDIESADRRLWVLAVMKDGTKTMSDVHVIFKTMVLKMVMDFYSTVLSDRKTKDGIMGFLAELVSVPRAAEILIEGYGFMSWLSGVVGQFNKDDRVLISTTIRLIRNLSRSISMIAFAKLLSEVKKNSEKDSFIDVNCFGELKINKELEQQILVLLTDLLPLTSILSTSDRAMFLNIFNVFSKKTLKLVTHKQMLMLVRNCSDGFEGSSSVRMLSRAVSTSDSSILKVDNLYIDDDDSDDYVEKNYVLKTMRKIIQKYL